MTQSKGDSHLIPDSTERSAAALIREIAALKEIVFTRLDGMDRAIIVFNENLTRAPTEVTKQIDHLRELHGEKFAGVQTQFSERDTRVERTAIDANAALGAALAAAKEAVAKSEVATWKQIDQIGQTLSAQIVNMNTRLDDLKERLTRIEGQELGQKTAVTTQQTSNMNTVSIIGLILGVLIAGAGLVIGFVGP